MTKSSFSTQALAKRRFTPAKVLYLVTAGGVLFSLASLIEPVLLVEDASRLPWLFVSVAALLTLGWLSRRLQRGNLHAWIGLSLITFLVISFTGQISSNFGQRTLAKGLVASFSIALLFLEGPLTRRLATSGPLKTSVAVLALPAMVYLFSPLEVAWQPELAAALVLAWGVSAMALGGRLLAQHASTGGRHLLLVIRWAVPPVCVVLAFYDTALGSAWIALAGLTCVICVMGAHDESGSAAQPQARSNRRWLRALGRSYKSLATLLFTTLLLLGVLLRTVDLVLPHPDQTFERQASLIKLFAPTNYYLLGEEEVRQLAEDHTQANTSGLWQVHPWSVGSGTNRPITTKTLNVDSVGRRRTIPPSAAHAKHRPLVVWFFGGSTMLGWAVPDEYTIPSLVQAELQALFPERQVKCVNLGVAAFNSNNELVHFTTHLRWESEKPHVALFMDGLNDHTHFEMWNSPVQYGGMLSEAWEKHRDSLEALSDRAWVGAKPNFPLSRLSLALLDRDAFRHSTEVGTPALEKWRNAPRPDDLEAVRERQRDLSQAAAEWYLWSQAAIDALAQRFDVATVFINQPQVVRPKGLETYIDLVCRGSAEREVSFHDMSASLDSLFAEGKQVYGDGSGHYNCVASKILAKKFARIIQDRLKK